MPRATQRPVVYLALSPNMAATAFGIDARHVYAAIAAGELEIRQLPGTIARRIAVRDLERWFRKRWITK